MLTTLNRADRRRKVDLGILVLTVFVFLSGCGRFYWSRPGATLEDFRLDSQRCAGEASPTPEAARYGLIMQDAYRACLVSRGWMRERHEDPPPSGWYRGVE